MQCKHCEEPINPNRWCDICRRKLTDQCRTCHEEVAHGQIRNQNFAICNGHPRPENTGKLNQRKRS